MKDICVVSTNTFFAPLVATYLHPRVIHLVYDLFPEALIHSGKWREGSLKVHLARAIVGRTMRRSAKNVFLGSASRNMSSQFTENCPMRRLFLWGRHEHFF